MAGFTSMDDLINQMTTNGKLFRADWNKNFLPTTAATSGQWSCLARGAGNPAADTIYNAGTNLAFQSVCDQTAGSGGILHGGNVGAAGDGFKCILNASAGSAAVTTMPSILMLVDLLAFVRVTSVTTTSAQTVVSSSTFTADASTDVITHASIDFNSFTKVQLTTSGSLPSGLSTSTYYWTVRQSSTTSKLATSFANAIAGTTIDFTTAGSGTHTIQAYLPRYSDGAGVQCIFWNTNATPLGAATPNLSIGYTNSAGTASRATPTVLPIGNTAAPNGNILYSGTGTGKYGPFVPLQAGDAGIQSLQSITNSVSYVSGEYSVGLCKPLLYMPMTTVGVFSERDCLSQIPSLPKVYDGANLHWLIYAGAAIPTNSAFVGHLDLAWS